MKVKPIEASPQLSVEDSKKIVKEVILNHIIKEDKEKGRQWVRMIKRFLNNKLVQVFI